MTEMPDTIKCKWIKNLFDCDEMRIRNDEDGETYTHSRIVEQLRKERDELAALVVGLTRVYTDSRWDEGILNTIELAKKVTENGNA